MSLFNLIKNVVKKVQEKNAADPNIKTADESVFKNMIEKLPTKEAEVEVGTESQNEWLEKIAKGVKEVQTQNEADPHVETADASVFADMMREIDDLKSKVATYETNAANPPSAVTPPPAPNPNAGLPMKAVTNSNGGSLQLYKEADMGSPKYDLFIPDMSLITVLQYSDKGIRLDGQDSKFVLIDYNGTRGWTFDTYLNFN